MARSSRAAKEEPSSAMMTVTTPVGPLTIAERDSAIVAVHWGKAEREDRTALLEAAKAQLDGYFFCGLTQFELPLAPSGSEFDRKVWRAMQEIHYGRTKTYGVIAGALCSNARDVSGALGCIIISSNIHGHRGVACAVHVIA